MRKGISLMEMLIAIILLGVISSIGYTYYKNYYDTSLAAKQTKVAILVDQANQMKNMLELYKIKFGTDVAEADGLQELVDQGFMTEIPASIPDISAAGTGWVLDQVGTDIDASATGLDDLYITYALDGSGTAADKLDYCNAVNNLGSNGAKDFTVTAATLENAIGDGYTNVSTQFFCYDSAADDATFTMIFIAKLY